MTWLLESPVLVAILGFLLIAGIGVCWIMAGRKELLYALIAAIALVAGLLVAERMITTDREAIEAMLTELAADVQSNSVARVAAHIHSAALEIKSAAQSEMPNYQFTEMRITAVNSVDVDPDAKPRTANVEFNVVASGTFKVGSDQITTTVPRWVRLQMVKDTDGKWRVTSYEHAEPQKMIMRN